MTTETAPQFAKRLNTLCDNDFRSLEALIEQAKALKAEYALSVHVMGWTHAGDLGRIHETLTDVIDRLSWIK